MLSIMYKVLITFLLALCWGEGIYAQSDTIYFDAKWKLTNKENRSYYRLFEKSDSSYKVRDYYLTGQLQMSGSLSSLDTADKNSKNGYFIFYDSVGHKESEGFYKEGKRTGLWKIYFRKTGGIRAEHYYENNKLNGYTIYYDSLTGNKVSEGNFDTGARTGLWKTYYRNGDLHAELRYEENKLNGHTVYYDSLTHLKISEGDFADDKAVGIWTMYREGRIWVKNNFEGKRRNYTVFYQNGIVKEKAIYKNGKRKSGVCFDFNGKPMDCPQFNIEYTIGQQVAYPLYDFRLYVKNTFYYPQYAKELGINGPVKLQFCINEDGTVSDVSVLNGIGGGCDEEAIRIIKNMPRWNPRITNNKPEKSILTYTIVF